MRRTRGRHYRDNSLSPDQDTGDSDSTYCLGTTRWRDYYTDEDYDPRQDRRQIQKHDISPRSARTIVRMINENVKHKSIERLYSWYRPGKRMLERLHKIIDEASEAERSTNKPRVKKEKSSSDQEHVMSLDSARNIIKMLNSNKSEKAIRSRYKWFRLHMVPKIRAITSVNITRRSSSRLKNSRV